MASLDGVQFKDFDKATESTASMLATCVMIARTDVKDAYTTCKAFRMALEEKVLKEKDKDYLLVLALFSLGENMMVAQLSKTASEKESNAN